VTIKRFANRATAIAAFPLPYELLVPELFTLLAQDAALSPASCSYVVDLTRHAPADFVVLNGSEGTTEALRSLRAAGIWPAPSSFPSIEEVAASGVKQRLFAGNLWGEGCPEEGPWTQMWRERGVHYGCMLMAISKSGRAAIGLYNCGHVPEDTRRPVEMGEALSAIIAGVLDRPQPVSASPEVLLKETHLGFSPSGEMDSLGVDCAEMLRDAGGGGAGAVSRMRARAEAMARALIDQVAMRAAPAVVGGPAGETGLRSGLFRLRDSGPRPIARSHLATSAFGKFELTLNAAAEPNGAIRVLGSLKQYGPRAVLLARALIVGQAPMREIELVHQLDAGQSLTAAAAEIGIAASSAETMVSRLCERLGIAGRAGLLDAMVEAGRLARMPVTPLPATPIAREAAAE
jgi:hypothetical protein